VFFSPAETTATADSENEFVSESAMRTTADKPKKKKKKKDQGKNIKFRQTSDAVDKPRNLLGSHANVRGDWGNAVALQPH
jgi:hypothetical protein